MLCANCNYNPSVLLEISWSVSEPMDFGFYINNVDKGNSKATLTVWNLVFTGCNCTCKHLEFCDGRHAWCLAGTVICVELTGSLMERLSEISYCLFSIWFGEIRDPANDANDTGLRISVRKFLLIRPVSEDGPPAAPGGGPAQDRD